MDTATSMSWVIAGVGIVLAAATLVVFRRPATALHVLLDLLLAAGLLRLSAHVSWSAIAVTAAVILIRRMLTRGLLSSSAGTATPGAARARRPVPR